MSIFGHVIYYDLGIFISHLNERPAALWVNIERTLLYSREFLPVKGAIALGKKIVKAGIFAGHTCFSSFPSPCLPLPHLPFFALAPLTLSALAPSLSHPARPVSPKLSSTTAKQRKQKMGLNLIMTVSFLRSGRGGGYS